MYEPRNYRFKHDKERFSAFTLRCLDTDLWIGIDNESYNKSVIEHISSSISTLRQEFDAYIRRCPAFLQSEKPLEIDQSAPALARKMYQAANKAGTGPMAAVAGAFAWYTGTELLQNFPINEIIVENGGDIFLSVKKSATISLYAGESRLSGKLGLIVPPEECPIGVCTSSGTVGHSKSYGNSDAVMIASSDIFLADALATAYGNRVQTAKDVEPLLDEIACIPEVLAAAIIIDGKIGLSGQLQFVNL